MPWRRSTYCNKLKMDNDLDGHERKETVTLKGLTGTVAVTAQY